MGNDHYQPNSREFEGMPVWSRSFWLSRAYLEASACLCKAMLDDDFSNQYSSSRVVMHLVRQGVELFLKAAILRATQISSRSGHNLDKLFTEYRESYPEDRYDFKFPTAFSLREELDLFPETVQSYHSTLDQRHRYPADLKGNDFASPELFSPAIVLREIGALSRSLFFIESAEFGVFTQEAGDEKEGEGGRR